MVKHIEHLEDLVFTMPKEELYALTTALVRHVYIGEKSGSLSIKMDGRPSIVFGTDENWEVFVSTKSFFNKNPVMYKSKKDIQVVEDPELRKKLEYYLDYFTKNRMYLQAYAGKVTWYQADILRDPFNENATNVISYNFDKLFFKDDLKFVFTIIARNDYIASRSRIPGEYTPMLSVDKVDYSKVMEIDEQLRLYRKVPKRVAKTKKEATELKKAVNLGIRLGEDRTHLSVLEFEPHFSSLKIIKEDILQFLKENATMSHKCYYRGKRCDDEGYVFKYGDMLVKLIDRPVFSKRNFDKNDL